ncbi:MAG: HAD family phosphatase [Planctomycetota bacterium]|nr:HAD family phosphatase [Planctomycetota bacterium]
MQKIEAIIFDWGGVLIDDPRPALMRYCSKALGVSEKDYLVAHWKFAADFIKGLISEDVFWARVCGELNKPRPKVQSLWGDAFRAAYSPMPQVFAMVSRLRNIGCKTALLSNTEVPAVEFFGELQYDMFDVAVFSCAEGITKPERKIYEITVDRLGLQPGQVVFIDDRLENINGAKQAGLNTILFRDIEQVRKELSRLSVKTS